MSPLELFGPLLVCAAIGASIGAIAARLVKHDETKSTPRARYADLRSGQLTERDLKAYLREHKKDLAKESNEVLRQLKSELDDRISALRDTAAARWESQMRKTLQLEERIANLEERDG